MRTWTLAVLSLGAALLGVGSYVAALEVAESSLSHSRRPHEWRLQAPPVRDELGRPTCRRNNFADSQRPLIRIGHNCP